MLQFSSNAAAALNSRSVRRCRTARLWSALTLTDQDTRRLPQGLLLVMEDELDRSAGVGYRWSGAGRESTWLATWAIGRLGVACDLTTSRPQCKSLPDPRHFSLLLQRLRVKHKRVCQ